MKFYGTTEFFMMTGPKRRPASGGREPAVDD
jgi:hypothetical protein